MRSPGREAQAQAAELHGARQATAVAVLRRSSAGRVLPWHLHQHPLGQASQPPQGHRLLLLLVFR